MTSINDFSEFVALRREARLDQSGTLRDVAEQFEALFVQSMLKSMREASFGDPLFGNSAGSRMFQDMFDQQIAGDIASGERGGIGLADLLVRQMSGTSAASPSAPAVSPVGATGSVESTGTSQAQRFIADILPHAKRAAAKLGVSPLAIMAQTALETGWGKRVMPAEDGLSSHNLFGIKAHGGWQGDVVQHRTIEFTDGVASRQTEPFRAYTSIAESFDDYVALLRDNRRYVAASGTADNVHDFAAALQSGGYATDPDYANKIAGIAGGGTMRRALAALKESDLLSLATKLAGEAARRGGN